MHRSVLRLIPPSLSPPMLETDPRGSDRITKERLMNLFSTAGLARSCARHPLRVIGAWLVILILAFMAMGGLDDALTSSADFTGNPDYQIGADLLHDRLRGDR